MKIRRNEVMDYVRIGLSNSKALADGYRFEDIIEFCENKKITITEEMIKEFLAQKAKEAGVDMNGDEFGVNVQLKTGSSYKEENDKLIKRSVERFMNSLKKEKYRFSEIELRYQKESFEIYKNKTLKLCQIIEMMAGRIDVDKTLFKDLDIWYNCDYVNFEDVERVLIPLIYNFSKAVSADFNANNLDTYLTKMFDDDYKRCHYYEYLPDKNLQFKHFGVFGLLETGKPEQYIELTEKQKSILELQYKKNSEYVAKKFHDSLKLSMEGFLDD